MIKFNIKPLKVIFIVFLSLIILIFVIKYFSFSANKDIAPTNQSSQKPDIEIKELGNQETGYINNYYGYQMTFPTDWTYDQIYSRESMGFYDPKASLQGGDGDLNQGIKIEIITFPKEKFSSLDNYLKEYKRKNQESIVSWEEKKINEQRAVQIIEDSWIYSISTYFESKNSLISINGYIPGQEKENYITAYLNIISTFQFLD